MNKKDMEMLRLSLRLGSDVAMAHIRCIEARKRHQELLDECERITQEHNKKCEQESEK